MAYRLLMLPPHGRSSPLGDGMTITTFATPLAAVALGLTALVPAQSADLDKAKAPVAPVEIPSSFFLFTDTQVSYR